MQWHTVAQTINRAVVLKALGYILRTNTRTLSALYLSLNHPMDIGFRFQIDCFAISKCVAVPKCRVSFVCFFFVRSFAKYYLAAIKTLQP